jgi:type IV pilus assembly protein PilB
VETSELDYEQPVGSDDPIVADVVQAASGPQSVEPFLKALVEIGGSDLHCKTGSPPRVRIDGRLRKLQAPMLTGTDTEHMVQAVLSDRPDLWQEFRDTNEADFAYSMPGVGRFRVNAFRARGSAGLVFRRVSVGAIGLEDLGLPQVVSALSMEPRGLVLVTGPTGSGKTVTLYSALNSLNSEDIKILTAEDPVEFNFKGINQVNVHQEVGMTFAAALKAFLRQDPDIIMVGEIRDYETAEIAIKAAMTGHLVFSTLHTNDSAATIGRLVDIGVPPYMIASSVTMVLSQRLGRRLCQKCKRVMEHDPKELVRAGFREDELAGLTIYGPVGCPECNGLGYRGRVGFFELMEVTEEVAKAISAEVPEDQLRKIAIQEGMTPLRQAALLKVKQGITSVDEALRRTVAHEESMPAYLINPDVEEYEDGDVIIREGNRDIDFFKLIRGALTVVKGGKKIAELTEPGEYFGEMAAISGEQRTASIISQGRSTIKRFPGDKLDEIIHKYPDVSSHLFRTMTTRLHKSNQIIVKLAGGGQRKPPSPGSSPRPAGT